MRPDRLPLGFVFRSRATKDEKAAAAEAPPADSTQPRDPQAPKGRPTPKRSEARSQRRSVSNTPMTRKEAAKRQREERRRQLDKQREALAGGDERYLPARDQGKVRKFTRDFVDSRLNVAETFLPMAVVILVMSIVRVAELQTLSLLLWLVLIVLIVLDSILISFRLRKQLVARFPEERHKGAVAYALMRSLQVRRLRLPKPQVKRGAKL
ncbi:DUF3043 domain-containing protein [Streptomyces roseirectus]|uniref:DUF3043 domain-containing protein n=1 Tax=Streptomyces roseirectus TaxID=2768066 RepID=A0A7H0IK17_9ACTN|nr:DUF3043 domain-containing protein [Streptomyces roseirectus]QNP73133.1 DUF3043 domain-containing protein [Streptomyces roseirectus]